MNSDAIASADKFGDASINNDTVTPGAIALMRWDNEGGGALDGGVNDPALATLIHQEEGEPEPQHCLYPAVARTSSCMDAEVNRTSISWAVACGILPDDR